MAGGQTVWEDLEKFSHGGDLMAVNDIGAYWHHDLRHWATQHTEYMEGWLKYRLGHNYGARGHVFTHGKKAAAAIQFVWDFEVLGGTSGLFGVMVGLLLGYGKIVLAGMPMDNSGHFFGPPAGSPVMKDRTTFEDRAVAATWLWARDHIFNGRVRSLSGRTRDWLGEPE